LIISVGHEGKLSKDTEISANGPDRGRVPDPRTSVRVETKSASRAGVTPPVVVARASEMGGEVGRDGKGHDAAEAGR
jgi:hypothetical protein